MDAGSIQLPLSTVELGEPQNLTTPNKIYISRNLPLVNTLKMFHSVLQISNQGSDSHFHLLEFERWRREV